MTVPRGVALEASGREVPENASVGSGISVVVEKPSVENRPKGCHKLSTLWARCTHLVMSILESCGSRGNSAIFRPNLVSSCDAGVDPGDRLVRCGMQGMDLSERVRVSAAHANIALRVMPSLMRTSRTKLGG